MLLKVDPCFGLTIRKSHTLKKGEKKLVFPFCSSLVHSHRDQLLMTHTGLSSQCGRLCCVTTNSFGKFEGLGFFLLLFCAVNIFSLFVLTLLALSYLSACSVALAGFSHILHQKNWVWWEKLFLTTILRSKVTVSYTTGKLKFCSTWLWHVCSFKLFLC